MSRQNPIDEARKMIENARQLCEVADLAFVRMSPEWNEDEAADKAIASLLSARSAVNDAVLLIHNRMEVHHG